MNPQDWEELLSDFQTAYAQQAQHEFTVVVAQAGKQLMSGRLGSMMHCGSVEVRIPPKEVVCYCFVLMVRGPNPDEVWDTWDRLAGKAGAKLLPADIAEAGVFGEDGPQSLWCAFLVHRLRGKGAFVGSIETGKNIAECRITVGGVNGLAHGVIVRNPFGASVRAIQDILYPKSSDTAPANLGDLGLPGEIASLLDRGDFPKLDDDEFAKLGAWLTADARKVYHGLDPANVARTRCMEEAKTRLREILGYNATLRQATVTGAGQQASAGQAYSGGEPAGAKPQAGTKEQPWADLLARAEHAIAVVESWEPGDYSGHIGSDAECEILLMTVSLKKLGEVEDSMSLEMDINSRRQSADEWQEWDLAERRGRRKGGADYQYAVRRRDDAAKKLSEEHAILLSALRSVSELACSKLKGPSAAQKGQGEKPPVGAGAGAVAQAESEEQPSGAEKPLSAPVDDDAMLSPRQLAERFGIPEKTQALKKRLARLRKTDLKCFTEVAERGSKDPQFLYRVRAVRPVIESLRTSRETSRKRPA